MIKDLIEKLNKMAKEIGDHDGEALVLASECDDVGILNNVAQALANASETIRNCAEDVKSRYEQKKAAGATERDLEMLAAIASEYDASGDAELIRTADVLDSILRTIGTRPEDVKKALAVDDEGLQRAREKAKKEEVDHYKSTYPVHEKLIQAEEAKKLIADRVKHYRPQQHALQTRSCPDHPGTMMVRLSEETWQCSLDGKPYNYQQGYTTLKGDKVPGGDVALQSQTMHNLTENTAFDSRITRLNQ